VIDGEGLYVSELASLPVFSMAFLGESIGGGAKE